ncbi:DUF6148 family protein [Fusobacterium varium]|uniref:DUF6148 family protein n=1 Tax=Fusobacterium varium TaxID=856 RepID=UPI00242AE103|nr:DUF6148 family protein [Fusobacterium varium]MCI6033993.1 DUF6148 family protein [Fusobacterium varium]
MTYIREDCLQMIEAYKKAELAVLSGKSYKIGTRELVREDLAEIRKGRSFWEGELDKLNNNGKRKLGRRVIPRDL